MMKSSLKVGLLVIICVAQCYGDGQVTLYDVSLGSDCTLKFGKIIRVCYVDSGSTEDLTFNFTLKGSSIKQSKLKMKFTGEDSITLNLCREDKDQLFLSKNSCDETYIPIESYTLKPYSVVVPKTDSCAKVLSFKLDVDYGDKTHDDDYLIGNIQVNFCKEN